MATREEVLRKYKPINTHKEVPRVRSGMEFVRLFHFFLLDTLCLSQQQPGPTRFLSNKNLNCIALCEGTLESIFSAPMSPP